MRKPPGLDGKIPTWRLGVFLVWVEKEERRKMNERLSRSVASMASMEHTARDDDDESVHELCPCYYTMQVAVSLHPLVLSLTLVFLGVFSIRRGLDVFLVSSFSRVERYHVIFSCLLLPLLLRISFS